VRDPRKLLPPIKHEPTSLTGLSHQTGVISMARAAEGTAQSDFFIVVGDMSGLDAHPDQPGDNTGFAAFGHVVSGMDVVHKLMTGAISPTLGADNGMKGQMLAVPVKVISARRTPKPVTPPAAAAPVSPTAAPVVTPAG
jgi:peptidyl-prolyl cis-trans isomerase A (cyclophilin A)